MSESAKGRVPWNKGKTGLAGHKKSVQERDKIAKANGIAIAMYDAESEALIAEFVSLSAACRYLKEETAFKGANTTILSRVTFCISFLWDGLDSCPLYKVTNLCP